MGNARRCYNFLNFYSKDFHGIFSKRLFANDSLIKNNKSFWVPPFFKKAASSEGFWKKIHQKPL